MTETKIARSIQSLIQKKKKLSTQNQWRLYIKIKIHSIYFVITKKKKKTKIEMTHIKNQNKLISIPKLLSN